jgi:hypothetical protein
MKNTIIILALALMLSMSSFAQDTTKTAASKTPCKVSNEIGINATALLKQIISLSYTNVQLLPYDLTYKLIFKNSAIRLGVGVLINNSQTTNTNTVILGQYLNTTAPPDQIVPNINNSFALNYRAGWEHRFAIGKRFVASAGLDFAGQYATTLSQSCYMNNDLPNYYDFNKEVDKTTKTAFGGGPVA